MAGLMDSITKGITTVNVKSSNMMEKNKLKTYIATLEKEITDLKMQVGEIIYRDWSAGNADISKVEQALMAISNKYAEIDRQNEKMLELDKQEQQILGSARQQAPAPGTQVRFCASCGAQNAPEYRFCNKCGAPLQ